MVNHFPTIMAGKKAKVKASLSKPKPKVHPPVSQCSAQIGEKCGHDKIKSSAEESGSKQKSKPLTRAPAKSAASNKGSKEKAKESAHTVIEIDNDSPQDSAEEEPDNGEPDNAIPDDEDGEESDKAEVNDMVSYIQKQI